MHSARSTPCTRAGSSLQLAEGSSRHTGFCTNCTFLGAVRRGGPAGCAGWGGVRHWRLAKLVQTQLRGARRHSVRHLDGGSPILDAL